MIATLLLSVVVEAKTPMADAHLARTRLEMRIAEAVLTAYRTDVGALPMGEDNVVLLDTFDTKLGTIYGRRLPSKDAWDHPLRCWRVGEALVLSSDGPDGIPAYDGVRDEGQARVWADDLVLIDGNFPDPTHVTLRALWDVVFTIEAYHSDQGVYPGPTNGLVTVSELAHELAAYREKVPTLDAWGNPILVFSQPVGFVLVSLGSDGTAQAEYDPSRTGAWPKWSNGASAPGSDLVFVRPQGNVVGN